MQSITLKDKDGTDVVFDVVRQPSANVSAILYQKSSDPSMNRTGLVKIELSSRISDGKTTPTATVSVPYGAVKDGSFVKLGQVSEVRTASQPANTPAAARFNAAAFARNLTSNAQVIALFENGVI